MKRIYRLFSIILAGGLLTACSSGDEPGESRLPDGKYPLTLTASLDGLKTRAGGMDFWQGGEEIAVNIGDYTGKYTVKAEGTATAAGTPYYWESTAKATVSAWYPYAEHEETYDISNQANGYAAFDFLYAQSEGSYAAPVALVFSHQMAKVSYTLVKGQGVTDTELNSASVKIFGDKSVTLSGGRITSAAASQTDEIVPCHDAAERTGSALMVPQGMTGKPLIKVSINGTNFVYTPSTEAAGNLQPGNQYSYTITVKADGISVTEATGGEWTDGGSENVGITIIYDGTETDAKIGDYYYSDGSWSDGGLRKLYADGMMEWAETTPQPESSKTVIGIVFYAGQHPNDPSNYASTGIGQEKCHGYAVALTDATPDRCMWGERGSHNLYPKDSDGNPIRNYGGSEADLSDTDWDGYDYTQIIINDAGGKGKLNATQADGYPATYYAVVAYENKCNAPGSSSGWFLPAIGQLWRAFQIRTSLFDGKNNATDFKKECYWTSSELAVGPSSFAIYVDAKYNFPSYGVKYEEGEGKRCVRPVLAF